MNIFHHLERHPKFRFIALLFVIILILWPAVAFADPGPGSIVGTVTNTGGTPVPSATVCAFDYYTYSLTDCDLSDIDGNYVLSGLPASDYRVEVTHVGYAFEMYDDYHYGNLNSATPVSVSDDTTTSGIDFVLEPGGDVSGTVYESDGVTPIEDVSVMIVFPDGSTRGNCTDASGNYTVGRVIHGVPLVIQAESVLNYCSGGPENFFTEYWEEAPVESVATPITLSAGIPNAPGIDFTLDDGADTSGRIFGLVTEDATGDPVSGAYVCAFDFYTYSLIDCEPSGTDGSYLISGLPSSDYRVEVSAAGYAYEMYDDLQYGPLNSATPVTVYQGMTAGGIDFGLEPGGDVSGTVYESDGVTPIEGISVMTIFPDGSSGGTCTNANGEYTLGRRPYGVPLVVKAYSVGNYCGGPENFFTEYWEEVPIEGLATEITLSFGSPNAPGIDFSLDDGADTSGRLFGFVTDQSTGLPISGAYVCANDFYAFGPRYCVTSGADGSYLISGLPASDYRVEVSAAGYAFEMYDNYFFGDPSSATPVTVYQNMTSGGIDFELEPGGNISGTVYENDGVTPIEDVSVMVIFPDGSSRGNCTDASGHYTLSNVPLGIPLRVYAYSVGNYCGGPENFFTEYWEETPLESLASEITLSAGTPNASGIDFTLNSGADTGGQIFGFVTDEASGDPIPGARVCVFNFDTLIQEACVTSGADGSYLTPGLPIADYRLEVHADGYAFEMYYEVLYGPVDAAWRVTVYQGLTNDGINFELEPGGNVSGTVYESDGVTPIEDVSVLIIYPDGSFRGSCTDASGQYSSEVYTLPYGVPVLVKAFAEGNYCGGPENYFEEYWQEAEVEADATAITLSAGTPNAPGTDFTLTQFVYTPTGTGVVVNPDPDVTITFDEVTVPGGTSVQALPGGDPPPPDGFLFMGSYYEIRSEADFTTAQVCFSYDDTGLTPIEEAGLLLYHYEGGAWVNVTDPGYPDVINNVLCGTVSDFSPFGLMLPINHPPVCEAAYPSQDLLWPANHSFRPIEILGVTDPDGDALVISVDAIFQDEAVNAFGSGHTAPDGQGVGTSTAYVRTERSGFGNGRVYHISFTADDGRGGTCSGTVMVGVPHHRGHHGAPVDDGAVYDSTEIPTPVKHFRPWARLMFRFLSHRWNRWH